MKRWLLSAGVGVTGLVLLASCGWGRGSVTPVRTPFNKGVYHYAGGRWDAAIAEFRLALEEEPRDYRARFNLAMALEAKARQEAALGEPEGARRWREAAAREYRELLAERPDDLKVLVNFAAREYEGGDQAGALARLRGALEKHPHAVPVRVALASHLLRQAREEATPSPRKRSLLAEARELLEGARQESPTDVAANMLLGGVHLEAGDVGDARSALRRALEREPADIATLLALARLETRQKRYAEAAVWAQRVVHVDPEHLEARLILAQALEEEGDLQGATVSLWKARELDGGRDPRLSSAEYRRRLLDLYTRLEEKEERERD